MSLKEFYSQNGYLIERGYLKRLHIEDIHAALEKEIYSSNKTFLRHQTVKYEKNKWSEDKSFLTNSLLDPHLMRECPKLAAAIKQLISSKEITDLLEAIDGEAHYTVCQTILFFASPGCGIHIDGWSIDSVPYGEHCHTLWIPLEKITADNSPPYIIPWKKGDYITPAAFGIEDYQGANAMSSYHQYHEKLIQFIKEKQMTSVKAILEPTDLLVFSSLTPHGTTQANRPRSRLSMQVIVRASSKKWARWYSGENDGCSSNPKGYRYIFLNKNWQLFVSDDRRGVRKFLRKYMSLAFFMHLHKLMLKRQREPDD